MICPVCGAECGIETVNHEPGGCGILNREKSTDAHLHCYCSRCLTDWIDRGN